ncbi:MAG: MoxR family ATPase [Arcanobacterium sp.]|nr:MoxR family ATPase [Arcanobacterium sp.]
MEPISEAPNDANNLRGVFEAVRQEIAKAVVGQQHAVNATLIGLLTGGHILLEGVPGTAKTLLVRAASRALSVDTKRIQFTPDLMPGDLTGSLVYTAATGSFDFRPGPVFTNILLADEINRTPPKTQSALLEAMAEGKVTVDAISRELPHPFMVVATQNPVEYEGTYSLPEAQLDRFLMKVTIPLPPREAELEMLSRHLAGFDPSDLDSAGIEEVASADDIVHAQRAVRSVSVHPAIVEYIVNLVRGTRESPAVSLGVSPRGATALLAATRAAAWLAGRDFATPDDVQNLAMPVLAHRIYLNPDAELDGLTCERVVASVIEQVAVPR